MLKSKQNEERLFSNSCCSELTIINLIQIFNDVLLLLLFQEREREKKKELEEAAQFAAESSQSFAEHVADATDHLSRHVGQFVGDCRWVHGSRRLTPCGGGGSRAARGSARVARRLASAATATAATAAVFAVFLASLHVITVTQITNSLLLAFNLSQS